MYHNPAFLEAMIEEQERRVRQMQKVRGLRASRAVVEKQKPGRWPIRLREALRA